MSTSKRIGESNLTHLDERNSNSHFYGSRQLENSIATLTTSPLHTVHSTRVTAMRLPYFSLMLGSLAAAQLQPITNFGTNKSGAKMFVYKPTDLPSNPAIVVGIHYCTGTAQKYWNSNPGLHELADQKKFLVIYPESPNSGGCWDVSSRATLKRDGGADSHGIAEMVRWVVDKYKADEKRVFAIGESSGGMMAVCRPFFFILLSWSSNF